MRKRVTGRSIKCLPGYKLCIQIGQVYTYIPTEHFIILQALNQMIEEFCVVRKRLFNRRVFGPASLTSNVLSNNINSKICFEKKVLEQLEERIL